MSTLTYNIDLRDWLEREADKQAAEQGPVIRSLIADATEAGEYFTDDELEEMCACMR